jgi:hypothetical protein
VIWWQIFTNLWKYLNFFWRISLIFASATNLLILTYVTPFEIWINLK